MRQAITRIQQIDLTPAFYLLLALTIAVPFCMMLKAGL